MAAVLLLAGCGTEPGRRAAAEPPADPAAVVASTAAPAAPSTAATEPPPAGRPTVVLASFPLDLGYPPRNGDDQSPVRVTTRPATQAFWECGRQVWDPGLGSSVIGVEFRGEAEWFQGRTLVLFRHAEDAATAVDRTREAVTSCPQDPPDDSGFTAHTVVDYRAGDQSFGWIDRYWSPEVEHFDTGLTVYDLVRVGRAVLLSYEYGEGNGSEETRRSATDRAAASLRPVVDRMADLPAGAPAP